MKSGAHALKIIRELWGTIGWTEKFVEQCIDDIDKLDLDDKQVEARIRQTRRESSNTANFGDIYADLVKLAKAQKDAQAPAAAPGGETGRPDRPYFTEGNAVSLRHSIPEWSHRSTAELCADWYAGVGIMALGGLDRFRYALSRDLRCHGCNPAHVEQLVDHAIRTNFDHDEAAKKAHLKLVRDHGKPRRTTKAMQENAQ